MTKGPEPTKNGLWPIRNVSKQTKLAIRRYALDNELEVGPALDKIVAKHLKKYL